MSLYDKVVDSIKKTEDAGHAERNRQNRESIKEAKEILLSQLSASQALEFIFTEFPAAGVRRSLAIDLPLAKDSEDIREAFKSAVLFKNIHECSSINSHDRITSDMQQLVESIKGYLNLATHADSDGGEKISSGERAKVEKVIVGLKALINDLYLYMDSKAEDIDHS